jgi:hypothetical protein
MAEVRLTNGRSVRLEHGLAAGLAGLPAETDDRVVGAVLSDRLEHEGDCRALGIRASAPRRQHDDLLGTEVDVKSWLTGSSPLS